MDLLGGQSAPPHEGSATQPTRDTTAAAPVHEPPDTTVDAGNTASTASRTTIASPQTANTQALNNLNVSLHGTTRPPGGAPSIDPGPDSFAERDARELRAMRQPTIEGNSSMRHQNGQGRVGTAHRQHEHMLDRLGLSQFPRPAWLDLSSLGEHGPYEGLDDTWQDDNEMGSLLGMWDALEEFMGATAGPLRGCRDIYEDVLAEEEAEDRAELDDTTTYFELSEAGRRALEQQGIDLPRQGETWTYVGEEHAERLTRAFGQY
ncbi:hypothetical protein KC360_g4612 [Hortaea werneckii]|nr:hypothetical protein KC325_g4092 [Hortaea werneckii]KAI6994819.1 hypothetical protein KC359_g4420 [Hortaea werneckii]KAI7146037.1 hypothetical protein KC344_g4003 [Hortaea werneckii]KAI7173878.1 hypothetical protein KC360_g4612 [Hortaea werneckii]